jgi:hypothetical protein
MGFSVAWNDKGRGVLELESYAATSSANGDATRFTVRKLPDPNSVRVRRDDRDHGAWRVTGPDAIEVDTTVGDHAFEIVTGYRGTDAARAGEGRVSGAPAPLPAPGATPRARTSMIDIVSAASTIGAGAITCPCCAGAA